MHILGISKKPPKSWIRYMKCLRCNTSFLASNIALHIKLNSIIYIFIAIRCTIVYRTETLETKATCSLPLSCIASFPLIPLQPVDHHNWFSSRESLLRWMDNWTCRFLPSEQRSLTSSIWSVIFQSSFYRNVFIRYMSRCHFHLKLPPPEKVHTKKNKSS